jgi:aldehyde:ferredoxin oxidoreductase
VGLILPLIAERRGPGDEIADGAASLALKYSYGDLAMTVKGMELPGYDPRGCWGQGLAYATCPAGGSHIGSMMVAPEIQGKPAGIPGARAAGKVQLTIFTQDIFNAIDCLVGCHRAAYCTLAMPGWVRGVPGWARAFFSGRTPGLATSIVDLSYYYQAVSFVTGIKYGRNTFLRAGERTFNLERLFNLREGFTSKDDILPLRFIGEPFREGPIAGKVEPLTKMLLKYYKLRGWNEVGIPTESTLKKLDIEVPR